MKLSLAGCVILDAQRNILLLRRIKTGWYELPGGKIDEGESADAAAIRELKEEICCDVEIVQKLGSQDFEENGYQMAYTWFLAKIIGDQMPRVGEPEKYDHVAFVPIQKLSSHKLSPNMENLLKAIRSGRLAIE